MDRHPPRRIAVVASQAAPAGLRARARALVRGVLVGVLFVACQRSPQPPAPGAGGAAAEVQAARQAQQQPQGGSEAPAHADAARGLVAMPRGRVTDAQGRVVWDFDAFDFVAGEAPPTVHPGLWRQARLNNHRGLFKVTEGIHQLRGFDLANMTLIEGRSGWIVVDPLTSNETAAHALEFARRHLGARPVSAVVYTHSHVDHFGGVLGVLSAEDAARRRVPIVAPAGFMDEATSENVLAGSAMGRRAMFQFARDLRPGPEGLVDGGLGKTTSLGRIGLLPPTRTIERPREELTIDGVRFVFFNVPGSEAPAEFTFLLPDHKAYCGADLFAHSLHNVMTPRGAKVRDALRWAGYMRQALSHVEGAEVYFGSHNWPVWGAGRMREFVAGQADAMKYLHDQTVRLFNAGLNPDEIAEELRLPAELDRLLFTHGYYGTVKHNVRGVFQFYLSGFDGNPATLDPLPRRELGRRLVELAGGADIAVARAQAALDRGDLRWAAQLLDGVLRAEPGHEAARALLVRTYRRLGFMAQSALWRNFYLVGAQELATGAPAEGVSRAAAAELLRHAPTERFLEAMAASLDGPRAAGVRLRINLVHPDAGETFVIDVERSVMRFERAERPAADAHATLAVTRPFFTRMMTGGAGAKELLLSDEARITGSRIDLARYFALLERAPGNFAIVPARE